MLQLLSGCSPEAQSGESALYSGRRALVSLPKALNFSHVSRQASLLFLHCLDTRQRKLTVVHILRFAGLGDIVWPHPRTVNLGTYLQVSEGGYSRRQTSSLRPLVSPY